MRSLPVLVIGVGNRDRGDDAVGPVVADLFAGRDGVATFVAEGDLSDLSLRWERDQRVVIVDAMSSGCRPATIVPIDALDERLPIDPGLVSSHGVGLAAAIELGRILDRLPEQLTIIAIEATAFELFGELTREVAEAIPLIVDHVERALGLSPCEVEPRQEEHRARTVDV